MMPTSERILKQDSLGRVWTPRAQREAILDEFERSGMPATKFAAHIGVKYQTLANWAQRRRKARLAESGAAAPASGAVRRVEAGGADLAAAGPGLVIHVPGGARLEVHDATQAVLAAQVLGALQRGVGAC
jgi:hypothetical protein